MIELKDLEIQPLQRSETIPSSWYTDSSILEQEHEHIFRKTWQYAGRRSDLVEQGSHIVATVGKEPIIVVRGKDDVIRAFYNVCRHRGGPLATENGCSSMLQCKYHGWTYQLDGMLRGVPDFDRVELFDKKDYGLVPVLLDDWEGLLFVALEQPSVSLEQMLAGVRDRIRSVDLTTLKFFKRVIYDVNCNWKAYIDNYLEGYHVPIVHPELMKLYDFNQYETDTYKWYSLQHSPLRADEVLYSKRVREGGIAEALYYFIFPNLMLNILPGRLQTNLILPVDAHHCKVIFDYYYEDITSPEALAHIEEDIRFSELVQQEDIEICEFVQRGLNSSAYDRGRFSVKREKAVYHFQTLLKRMHKQRMKANDPA